MHVLQHWPPGNNNNQLNPVFTSLANACEHDLNTPACAELPPARGVVLTNAVLAVEVPERRTDPTRQAAPTNCLASSARAASCDWLHASLSIALNYDDGTAGVQPHVQPLRLCAHDGRPYARRRDQSFRQRTVFLTKRVIFVEWNKRQY